MVKREVEGGLSPENEKMFTGIVAANLSLSAGTKRLIDRASFVFGGNERTALIGRNGAGKTVLLETIYSTYQGKPLQSGVQLEGVLEVHPGTRVAYLPQDLQIDFEGTVDEFLDLSSHETARVVKEFTRLSRLVQTDPSEATLATLARTMEAMDSAAGWNYQESKESVIRGLGLTGDYLKRKVRQISGGEATKVALAGVLIAAPNIALLDEPTNNLDIGSLLFLEEWIRQQQAVGFVIVSHDRRFLDNTVKRVWEIDEETAKMVPYGGNYSFYRQEKQKIWEGQSRAYQTAVRKKSRLEEAAQKLKTRMTTFEETSPEPFFRRKGAKLQKRAIQMRTRADKLISEAPEPQPPKLPHIDVGEVKPGEARVFAVKDLRFRYPKSGQELFGGFTFSLHQGEKVAIIGANGTGKSTLLKILAGEYQPGDSRVNRNAEMTIGYLPQSLTIKDPEENLLDFSCRLVIGHREDINRRLGKVLFEDSSQMRVGGLSLGELKRVLLTIIFAQGPDLLLLDEPVNHLDLYTAEMLDGALEQYRGTVVVVSHDRYFLEKFGAKRLLVTKGQTVSERAVNQPSEIIEAFGEILDRRPGK